MQTTNKLDKSIHIRLDTKLESKIADLAIRNGLKPSSIARSILVSHLNDLKTPFSDLPIWMR